MIDALTPEDSDTMSVPGKKFSSDETNRYLLTLSNLSTIPLLPSLSTFSPVNKGATLITGSNMGKNVLGVTDPDTTLVILPGASPVARTSVRSYST